MRRYITSYTAAEISFKEHNFNSFIIHPFLLRSYFKYNHRKPRAFHSNWVSGLRCRYTLYYYLKNGKTHVLLSCERSPAKGHSLFHYTHETAHKVPTSFLYARYGIYFERRGLFCCCNFHDFLPIHCPYAIYTSPSISLNVSMCLWCIFNISHIWVWLFWKWNFETKIVCAGWCEGKIIFSRSLILVGCKVKNFFFGFSQFGIRFVNKTTRNRFSFVFHSIVVMDQRQKSRGLGDSINKCYSIYYENEQNGNAATNLKSVGKHSRKRDPHKNWDVQVDAGDNVKMCQSEQNAEDNNNQDVSESDRKRRLSGDSVDNPVKDETFYKKLKYDATKDLMYQVKSFKFCGEEKFEKFPKII